ncbi:hypothetical protein EGW08_000143, partial [Elysia chlorotica]
CQITACQLQALQTGREFGPGADLYNRLASDLPRLIHRVNKMSLWQEASALLHRLFNTFGNYHILQIAVAAAAIVTSSKAGVYVYTRQRRRQLMLKIQARRQKTKQGIEELREELKNIQINPDIPTWGISQLHTALQSGHVTATEVLRAYQAKALEVNERTN